MGLAAPGPRRRRGRRRAPVGYGTRRGNAVWLAVIVAGSALSTLALTRVHLWLPRWFPEPAAYPLLDASTTVMSFVAMILMAWRRVECWYLWILVDVVDIGLYAAKEVFLLSAVYVLFLALAVRGASLAGAGGRDARDAASRWRG